jgi:hypothetical protein
MSDGILGLIFSAIPDRNQMGYNDLAFSQRRPKWYYLFGRNSDLKLSCRMFEKGDPEPGTRASLTSGS